MAPRRGGCHCGAVRWEADLPDDVTAHECNCSLCGMLGFQHVIVPKSRFRLLSEPGALRTYTFGTVVAQHTFCSRCGVKSHYVPRSNPDGISVNLRCMDHEQFASVTIEPFDGRHWEENAASLRHLSAD